MPHFDSVPPPTEIPDYVLYSKRYDRAYIPRQRKQPKDDYKVILHPDGEAALKAAKTAVKQKRGSYFGRAVESKYKDAFNVYENGKVVEQHAVTTSWEKRPG